MRTLLRSVVPLVLLASPALAAEAGGPVNLLDPAYGLMFWTLIIFVILFFTLSRFAFKPLTAAVEAREKALEEAIAGAKRDRDAASALLAEQQRQLDASRAEAQKLIADGRAAAERMRAELLDQTRAQQHEMLDRARREIDAEKVKAVAEMRREAVDLALAAASKVVEQNLDQEGNRVIVERFLAGVGTSPGAR
jgi:F-type H+-transporting ATPase subunit b